MIFENRNRGGGEAIRQLRTSRRNEQLARGGVIAAAGAAVVFGGNWVHDRALGLMPKTCSDSPVLSTEECERREKMNERLETQLSKPENMKGGRNVGGIGESDINVAMKLEPGQNLATGTSYTVTLNMSEERQAAWPGFTFPSKIGEKIVVRTETNGETETHIYRPDERTMKETVVVDGKKQKPTESGPGTGTPAARIKETVFEFYTKQSVKPAKGDN